MPAESQIQELFCSSIKFDQKISINALANAVYFTVLIKEISVQNENSPIMGPITKMGVVHEFKSYLPIHSFLHFTYCVIITQSLSTLNYTYLFYEREPPPDLKGTASLPQWRWLQISLISQLLLSTTVFKRGKFW